MVVVVMSGVYQSVRRASSLVVVVSSSSSSSSKDGRIPSQRIDVVVAVVGEV